MTAPIKTCNYCRAVGVMPTFMNGETVCYDCLQTLPKTLLEAWREIASLRAKIEQMERQEPAGWQRLYKDGSGSEDFTDLPDVFERQRSLYALPGAQPEPSEQDESVRKAWSRFSNELHRSPDAPYPGMSEAFEQHFSQSFTDRDWRVESGVWAAAWKAAKLHGAQPAPSVPDGWKLVPIEPTEKMINEGTCASTLPGPRYIDSACAKQCWTNMLAAAPEAKP